MLPLAAGSFVDAGFVLMRHSKWIQVQSEKNRRKALKNWKKLFQEMRNMISRERFCLKNGKAAMKIIYPYGVSPFLSVVNFLYVFLQKNLIKLFSN